MVWTRALGPGIQEGTPLVYNGVMYFPNPMDLVKPSDAKSGDMKWQYRRRLPEELGKFFPVPAINRNLDIYGDMIIDAATTTERFRRTSYGTLEIEVTVNDPKVYTRPWTVAFTQRLVPDEELIEFICLENETSTALFDK